MPTKLERFEAELRKKEEKKKRTFGDLFSGMGDEEREDEIRGSAFKNKKIAETKDSAKRETAKEKMIREANEASASRAKKRKEHEKNVNSNNYEDGGIAKKKCKKKSFGKLEKFLKKGK